MNIAILGLLIVFVLVFLIIKRYFDVLMLKREINKNESEEVDGLINVYNNHFKNLDDIVIFKKTFDFLEKIDSFFNSDLCDYLINSPNKWKILDYILTKKYQWYDIEEFAKTYIKYNYLIKEFSKLDFKDITNFKDYFNDFMFNEIGKITNTKTRIWMHNVRKNGNKIIKLYYNILNKDYINEFQFELFDAFKSYVEKIEILDLKNKKLIYI